MRRVGSKSSHLSVFSLGSYQTDYVGSKRRVFNAGIKKTCLNGSQKGSKIKGMQGVSQLSQRQIDIKINEAQDLWVNTLLSIVKHHKENPNDDAGIKQKIEDFVSRCYAFDADNAKISFKPTLASEVPFRSGFEESCSYFLGAKKGGVVAEDTGFALKDWVSVSCENKSVQVLSETQVIVQGNMCFTSLDETKTIANYTFGYLVTDSGQLKAFLHHSSLQV